MEKFLQPNLQIISARRFRIGYSQSGKATDKFERDR